MELNPERHNSSAFTLSINPFLMQHPNAYALCAHIPTFASSPCVCSEFFDGILAFPSLMIRVSFALVSCNTSLLRVRRYCSTYYLIKVDSFLDLVSCRGLYPSQWVFYVKKESYTNSSISPLCVLFCDSHECVKFISKSIQPSNRSFCFLSTLQRKIEKWRGGGSTWHY